MLPSLFWWDNETSKRKNGSKGPFIHYASTGMGGWDQKMAIFAQYEYINHAHIVGGSENVPKLAYVIYEWYLAWARACSCMPKHLSWGLEAVFWPHFFSFARLFTSLPAFLFRPYSSARKNEKKMVNPVKEGHFLVKYRFLLKKKNDIWLVFGFKNF